MLDLNTDEGKKKLASRIKELRTEAKLTQAQLAEKLFTRRETVSSWEKGKNPDKQEKGKNPGKKEKGKNPGKKNIPEYSNLSNLCQALNTDLGYLFGDYDEKNYDIHKVKEYTGLSEKAIEVLNEKTVSKLISFLLEDNDFRKALLVLLGIAFQLAINADEAKKAGNDLNVDLLRQIQQMRNAKSDAREYMACAINNFIDHREKDLGYPDTLKQKNNDYYTLINKLSDYQKS